MKHSLRSFIAALACSLGLTFHTPAAATDYLIGQIILVGLNFCPRDTLDADGRLLHIAQHTPLFALYGTTYGGDGRTTFGLPNMENKAPVRGQRYCVVVEGLFPSRP